MTNNDQDGGGDGVDGGVKKRQEQQQKIPESKFVPMSIRCWWWLVRAVKEKLVVVVAW
jgi:hypothetical protein